jgi:hypothetical protein
MDAVGKYEDVSRTPWTVEGLIARAEWIMSSSPGLFPPSAGESNKELNIRLIRDYVVREFIPRPTRVGREARFGLDHLVHLLAVRTLLRGQKWSLPAIKASFVNVSADDLLNGVLEPVRSLVEAEYQKATNAPKTRGPCAEENLGSPPLNAAQLLIEKFKAATPSQAKVMEPHFPQSMAAAFVTSPAASLSEQRKSESRSKLHIQLQTWCEVVIDVEHLTSLTSEEIEALGEALKRRLQNETA